MSVLSGTVQPGAVTKTPSQLAEFWLVFRVNKGAVLGFSIFVVILVAALFAGLLAPHDPAQQFRDALLKPPIWATDGSARFLLGTDELGRDILSRLIYGARVSLDIAALSVLCSAIPGVILGLFAAFYPGITGKLILRLTDIMLALPGLLLAICVIAVLGPGLLNTMIAIAIGTLPGYVRLTRATAMSEMHKEYVVASKVAGASNLRLMFDTVLPNCMAPIIVNATLGFSSAVLEVAALGFLGLGVQAPTPEWGTMLSSARDYIHVAPWVVAIPGLTILIAVLAVNLVGDGLRDAMDPRLKRMS